VSDYRLYIETSGRLCALSLYDGNHKLASRSSEREKSHASLITVFMDELMAEVGINLKDLKYVVVSSGPGSYTGLRVGYSTAKGICYALDIPLIAVNSLESLAYGLSTKYTSEESLFCPIIDARRMEVYAALYNADGKEIMAPSAIILDESFNKMMKNHSRKIVFGGSGAKKLKDNFYDENFEYDCEIAASADFLVRSAQKKIDENEKENIAYSEPFYLKSVYIKK